MKAPFMGTISDINRKFKKLVRCSTMSYLKPPKRIPFWLNLGIKFAEHKTQAEMLPARILSWYPKAAISSGVLESLIAHGGADVSSRLLKLVRMQVSFMVTCPFCIDLNSSDWEAERITQEEIEALQGQRELETILTFTEAERVALTYSRGQTMTPAQITPDLAEQMHIHFNERQFVIITTTCAQVNYWARLIKGFGVPPVGMSGICSFPELEVGSNDTSKNT
jgi:alkylhydroperoxidase family enzyme